MGDAEVSQRLIRVHSELTSLVSFLSVDVAAGTRRHAGAARGAVRTQFHASTVNRGAGPLAQETEAKRG